MAAKVDVIVIGEMHDDTKGHKDYLTIAMQMVSDNDPIEVIAAILKYSLEDELNEKKYRVGSLCSRCSCSLSLLNTFVVILKRRAFRCKFIKVSTVLCFTNKLSFI